MAAVRVGHVKRALGDLVYVSGDSNIPPPRAGDTIIVVSMSGETEIVAGWCRNFKKMGGQIASIVGTPDSTIESLSDHTYILKGDWKPGTPSSFYMKSAYLLSPSAHLPGREGRAEGSQATGEHPPVAQVSHILLS